MHSIVTFCKKQTVYRYIGKKKIERSLQKKIVEKTKELIFTSVNGYFRIN